MLHDRKVVMGSLNNNNHDSKKNRQDTASTGDAVPSTPTNYGAQFLEAVRQNDGESVCQFANLLTSKCRLFSVSVPTLTRGLFDENSSVRSNAAYLLSEALHWIHPDDLNSWVLPSVVRALDTLDANGPLLWLSKRVGFVAHQISEENCEQFVNNVIRAFDQTDTQVEGLVTIAPFGNRLERTVKRDVLETLSDLLLMRAKLLEDPDESSELPDRDPVRMMLPSIGVSLLNFTLSVDHLGARFSGVPTTDLHLMERLENVLFQYVKGAISHIAQKSLPLSLEDKSIILPIAASMANTSIEWNAVFSELERSMCEHRDSFAAVLCRLTGRRRIADPHTVIKQARDELLSGQEFLLVVSTLENAYSSLTRGSLRDRRLLPESIELLQEIQELTLSSYVAFFAQRVKEALS